MKLFLRNTFFLLLAGILSATAQDKPVLTVNKIMQDPKIWMGTSPFNPFWSEDGTTLYFSWNPEANPGDSLYKTTSNGTAPVKVSKHEQQSLPSRFGVYSKDYSKKLYTKNGDIFLLDIKSKKERQLTNTLDSEGGVAFTKDEQRIQFSSGDNLFTMNLQTGAIVQLTNFKKGKESKDKKLSEQDEWLQQDAISMSKILQERKAEAEQRKAYNKSNEVKRPKAFYLDDKNVSDITLSPNERFITFVLRKFPRDSKRANVPNYVTESSYTEDISTRPKVGGDQMDQEVGVYDMLKDTIYMVKADNLSGLDDVQPYQVKKDGSEKSKKKREIIMHSPSWSTDGSYAVITFRSHDNKDRWIAQLLPETGTVKELDRQHDDAWIAGPGIGWSFGSGNMGWMPDNTSIWFQSEESGYSHLYTLDTRSGKKNALTSGKYEVSDPQISRDKKRWYFEANMDHPGDQQFYSLPINGGKITKLTTEKGGNTALLSPDESKIALLHSTTNQPWELYLQNNPITTKDGSTKKITKSLTKEFAAYPWREAEVITFKAADGADVHARIYKPETKTQNGPAVVFVHGAGYLQNAHLRWSSYFREYMFHNLLVDLGYTVLDIDYRGSAGYGRDWRTGIYQHMGGKDLSDHIDGARFLAKEHGVDPKKIGIYGGSYGGFITLMAMFTEPDVFNSGAALRSVTDWAHYNHGYTANILNTPVEDSLAYRKSSPIYYAEGLKGNLLILHGMIDTNVHFQDVVRLAQRLIELEKENWEMAVYPLENHGFVEPSSWTDEYRRILKLFEDNLK